MATHKVTIATESGPQEKESRFVPRTNMQLAVCHLDDGCWSLTHVASGFAILHSDSRERCSACGEWFWNALRESSRAAMVGNPKLPQQMAEDSALRDSLAAAGIRAREINKSKNQWSVSTILAAAKAFRNS